MASDDKKGMVSPEDAPHRTVRRRGKQTMRPPVTGSGQRNRNQGTAVITGRAPQVSHSAPPSLDASHEAATIALLSLPGERPFDERLAKPDGKYLLGEELGEGGMGRVIAARDVELGRTVALKRLRTETASDPSMVRALLFEARVAGQLEHPHIVPVHAVGHLEDGSVFYTMKLVGDLSLRDVLKQLRDGNEFAQETYTRHRLLQYH